MPWEFRGFCFEFLNVRQLLLRDPRLLVPLSDLAFNDQEAGEEWGEEILPFYLSDTNTLVRQ